MVTGSQEVSAFGEGGEGNDSNYVLIKTITGFFAA
jgi:hypothetical protein